MNGGTLNFLALYISPILESLNFLGPVVEEERIKGLTTLLTKSHDPPSRPQALTPREFGEDAFASHSCSGRVLSSGKQRRSRRSYRLKGSVKGLEFGA